MRALIVTIVLLVSFGPSCSLAQDQGKATATESQPPRAQDGLTKPADPQSDENYERRIMERMGPGMDWDHRKPGRDLRLSPRRERGDEAPLRRD
ncbi:hypothetical protein [Bradyrhizobium sp. C9]|uniref:hypothetical protein n=1 Tax=Bradyrhizobium sp. C9 TaxID=142585 RepID=UPI001177342C|nr:hypothetical protein [Bradyrhizobium sp. C9]